MKYESVRVDAEVSIISKTFCAFIYVFAYLHNFQPIGNNWIKHGYHTCSLIFDYNFCVSQKHVTLSVRATMAEHVYDLTDS